MNVLNDLDELEKDCVSDVRQTVIRVKAYIISVTILMLVFLALWLTK